MADGVVVVAGAFPLELKHIRALGSFRKEKRGGLCLEQGVIRGADAALVVSGTGDARAYAAAKEAIRQLSPRAYVSVGLSGGLAEGLEPGEIVLGESTGFQGGTRYGADTAVMGRLSAGLSFKIGPLLASETVVTAAAAKKKAAKASGCLAVDMESCGAARAAAEASVPFLAIRAISDTADEDLPVDFNRFMKDGRLDWGRFIPYIITHPGALSPLVRLGRVSASASKNLAGAFSSVLPFIRDCKALP